MINKISAAQPAYSQQNNKTNKANITFGLIEGGTTISKAASKAERLYLKRKDNFFFRIFKSLNQPPQTEMTGGHKQLKSEIKADSRFDWTTK